MWFIEITTKNGNNQQQQASYSEEEMKRITLQEGENIDEKKWQLT
jgi:hypothetical protein